MDWALYFIASEWIWVVRLAVLIGPYSARYSLEQLQSLLQAEFNYACTAMATGLIVLSSSIDTTDWFHTISFFHGMRMVSPSGQQHPGPRVRVPSKPRPIWPMHRRIISDIQVTCFIWTRNDTLSRSTGRPKSMPGREVDRQTRNVVIFEQVLKKFLYSTSAKTCLQGLSF